MDERPRSRCGCGPALAAVTLISALAGFDLAAFGDSLQEAIVWLVVIGFVVAQLPRVAQAVSTLGVSPIPLPLGPVYALQLAISYVNFAAVRRTAIEALGVLRGLRSPRRLALLFGGNLMAELLFAFAFGLLVQAFGYSLPLHELLFINMTVSLLAGLVPVPGGIGVAEGGLIFGLTSFGVAPEAAFAAVILYRLATFYTPPIWGFFSLRWLEGKRYL